MRFPVEAKTLEQLRRQSEPQPVKGGQSEALAWTFYDTATYTSAATTQITFFQTTRDSRRESNLSPAGQLPSPQYFEIWYWGMDVLLEPGATDVWRDMWRLVFGGTPTWTFSLADKDVGPFPLSEFHTTGGPQGFSTRTDVEYANNSIPDGGFCVGGAITIPHQNAFRVDLEWDEAQTISGESVELRVYMKGVLHRRVL